jgi:prevent-host-death family protein
MKRTTKTQEKRLSISDVRKMLTELVDRAAYQGQEVTITRNGRPMAKIVPAVPSEFQKLVRATVTDSKDILRGLE